jgi:hypothetical protein
MKKYVSRQRNHQSRIRNAKQRSQSSLKATQNTKMNTHLPSWVVRVKE